MSDMENTNVISPLEGEGVRGDGQARWYVVHTYSGHENKVKVNIEKMVENRGMQDLILDIIVPTEDRVEIKDGQRKIKTRKMFPGYVIIKMIVTNDSWYLVRNTQGVTGFVGHGSDPIPLTDEEVARMGIEKVYIDLDVEVGDTVRVISGPFESFMGEVLEINKEKQVLTENLMLTPAALGRIVTLVAEGKLSRQSAREVFAYAFDGGEDVDGYVKEHGLEMVSDDSAYEAILADVLARCQKDVDSYKAGNQKVFGFLVGQAMKALKGKADPKKINEMLRKALDS